MKSISTASVRHPAAQAGALAAALGAVLVAIFGAACAPTGHAPLPAPPVPSGASSATRGAADYEGTWIGVWVREQCTETGGAVGVACERLPLRDELQVRLTQRGSRVEGTLEFTGLRADVSGTAGADGTLALEGTNSAAAHSTRVTQWRSDIEGANGDRMTGSFTFSIAPDDKALGTVKVRAIIEELVKEGSARQGVSVARVWRW